MGHLIPAGTGFRSFQESEVRYNLQIMPEATESLAGKEDYPLLDAAPDNGISADGAPSEPDTPPTGLEQIFGSGDNLGE